MKKIILGILVFCTASSSYGQHLNYKTTEQLLKMLEKPVNVDSLKKVISTNIDDSTRSLMLFQISVFYVENNLDSSLKYVDQFNKVPLKSRQMEANGLNLMGDIYLRTGNASKALETLVKSLKIFETLNDPVGISMLYWNFGKVYQSQNDNVKAISYYQKANKISSAVHALGPQSLSAGYLGSTYLNINQLDSALYFSLVAFNILKQFENANYLPNLLAQLGNIYQKRKEPGLALYYYKLAIKGSIQESNVSAMGEGYIGIAELLKENKQEDSCYYYAQNGLALAVQLNNVAAILKASTFLKDFFKGKNRIDSAFKYQEIMMAAKDNMLSLEKIKKVQRISFEEQQRIQAIESQKKEFQNRIKLYVLFGSVAVFLFLAIFLYRNNLQKQKTNALLHAKNEEALNTLQTLKATQAQLIQAEKMASLGELTAGIAHEIQNPLNFVNNFSEANTELLQEMSAEQDKGNIQEAIAIANEVIGNNNKINHHGRRADAIVKSMLEHSRSAKGEKQSTNLNALADEYLRVAYHGLRAKNKEFNATIKTSFDETISTINVVPQEIGRVLLNLLNNAFYAVNEKKDQAGERYEPTVLVSTQRVDDKIEISIEDNGMGISKSVQDKIFQPFFTTKPTGEGTGLGLSLSYDIIKANSGELKVESEEGQYTRFTIRLPLS